MNHMKLKLANNLALPVDVVTQTIAVLFNRWLRVPAIEAAVSAVSRLLGGSRPSTVAGSVWAVVVRVAINRMVSRRSTSHVRVERFEAVAPAVAHGNPASAVFRIVRMVLVEAARFDALPRGVLDRVREAVGAVRCLHPLKSKASARRALFSKMILANHHVGAAIAPAHPGAMARGSAFGFVPNNKASESFPAQIFLTAHSVILPANGAYVGSVSR